MLRNVQFGWEIFTLRPVAFITVDVKKLVNDLFHNSPGAQWPRILPYAIQKHLAMHQSR